MDKKIVKIIIVVVLLAPAITGFFVIRHKVRLARNRKIMAERAEAAKHRNDGAIGVAAESAIRVPNLKGMTLTEAKEKLESIGFDRYYYKTVEMDSELDEGLIVKNEPGAGVAFNKADYISFTFYISNGKFAEKD